MTDREIKSMFQSKEGRAAEAQGELYDLPLTRPFSVGVSHHIISASASQPRNRSKQDSFSFLSRFFCLVKSRSCLFLSVNPIPGVSPTTVFYKIIKYTLKSKGFLHLRCDGHVCTCGMVCVNFGGGNVILSQSFWVKRRNVKRNIRIRNLAGMWFISVQTRLKITRRQRRSAGRSQGMGSIPVLSILCVSLSLTEDRVIYWYITISSFTGVVWFCMSLF